MTVVAVVCLMLVLAGSIVGMGTGCFVSICGPALAGLDVRIERKRSVVTLSSGWVDVVTGCAQTCAMAIPHIRSVVMVRVICVSNKKKPRRTWGAFNLCYYPKLVAISACCAGSCFFNKDFLCRVRRIIWGGVFD